MKASYFLFSLILSLLLSCKDKVQEPFSFVQMCDTQLGMGGYEHDKQTFEQAVKQINVLAPDFVVICGDLVNNATDSSFNDFNFIKNGFNMPCYCAPGNHDVENTPSDSSLVKYRNAIGKDYFDFQNKGHSFLVCNTQLWKVPTGIESEKHDKWFKDKLEEMNKKQEPVFVVGHFPLYLEAPDEKDQYFNLPQTKRKELLNLFEQKNVKAYLSGHTHKTIINNYKGIQLVSGEVTSKNFDKRPLGFRLWTVDKDSIQHKFVALENQ